MNLLPKLLLGLSLVYNVSLFAQEDDLDAIFDDGNSNRKIGLNIGTDLITLGCGTLNVYGELVFAEKFGLFAGVGVLPFGYLADFSDPKVILANNGKSIDRDFTGGRFLDLGMKLLQKSGSFSYYYYLGFKYWHSDIISVNYGSLISSKRKLTLGTGYTFAPINKLQFDLHGGAYIGFVDTKTEAKEYITLDLRVGFDLGFSVFYKF